MRTPALFPRVVFPRVVFPRVVFPRVVFPRVVAIARIPLLLLAPTLLTVAGCQSSSPAGLPEIPLHDQQVWNDGGGSAPVDLRVFRVSGPPTIGLGDAWTLHAEATDPDGEPLTFQWGASAGALDRLSGSDTTWTATSEVGEIEVRVQARDQVGNITQASFRVNVTADAPISPVEDVYDSVGYFCSLAIDSSDLPRIAYYDSTHPSLRYAAWDGSQWNIQEIEGYGLDIGGAAGMRASHALDSQGVAHIAYLATNTSGTSFSLNYATQTNGTWSITTVASVYLDTTVTDVDYNQVQLSLKLNPLTGKPEILYRGSASSIKLATCTGDCTQGANWTSSTIYTETRATSGTPKNYVYPGSLYISSQGARHVTFGTYANGTIINELRYATNFAGSWNTTDIISKLSDNLMSTRVELDALGQPLVLTQTGIFHKPGSTWKFSQVEVKDVDGRTNVNGIGVPMARYDLEVDRSRTPPSTGVVWMAASPNENSAMELIRTDDRGYFQYTYLAEVTSAQAAPVSLALDSSGQAHACWTSGGALYYQ